MMSTNSASSIKFYQKFLPRLKKAAYWVGGFLLFFIFVLTLFTFYIGTETGLKSVVSLLNHWGSSFTVAKAKGHLWRDVSLKGITLQTKRMKIKIESLDLKWEAKAIWQGKLDIHRLDIGHTDIQFKSIKEKEISPTQAPASLKLPFDIEAPFIYLSHLTINDGRTLLEDAQFTIKSNDQQHQFLLPSAKTPFGVMQGQANVLTTSPFLSDAYLTLKSTVEQKAILAEVKATGPLRQLYVMGGAKGGVKADIDVLLDVFAPYEYEILQKGKMRVEGLNLKEMFPNSLQAKLNIYGDVQTKNKEFTIGKLRIENVDPQPLNAAGIPFKTLQLNWQGTRSNFIFQNIELHLKKKGVLQGKGSLQAENFVLNLNAQAINPKMFWDNAMQGSLAGTINVDGIYHQPNITLMLEDPTKGINWQVRTGWRTNKKEEVFLLRELLLNHQTGNVRAEGEWNLLGKEKFNLKTQFTQFNPSKIGQYPVGNINASLNVQGALQPQLQIEGNYLFQPSQLNGAEVKGKGALSWVDRELEYIDASLQVGNNIFSAQGKYRGEKKDQLHFDVNFLNLSQIGQAFKGKLIGKGKIEKVGNIPLIQGKFEALDLQLPGNIAVRRLQLMGNIEPDIYRPFIVHFQGEGVKIGNLNMERADLDIKGTQANHTLNIEGKGKWYNHPLLINSKLEGNYLPDTRTWHSRVHTLKIGFADGLTQLRSLAKLQIGLDHIQLENVALHNNHSQIELQRFALDDKGQLDTSGRVVRLNMADVLAWLPDESLKSDLTINGSWQLEAKDTLNGKIELKRQAGDVIWKNKTNHRTLHLLLEELEAYATIKSGMVHLESRIVSGLGNLKAVATTSLSRRNEGWGMSPASDFNLRVLGTIPQLEALSAVFDSGIKWAGRLQMDVSRKGRIEKGIFSGSIHGSALKVQDLSSGVVLNNGVIEGKFSADNLTLEQCKFTGGSGTLHAQGRIGLNNQGATIKFIAEKFTAISRPDILAVLSGKGLLSLQKGMLSIQGKLEVDEAKISMATDTPTLSNDVVIVKDEVPVQRKPENFALKNVDLELDLGRKSSYNGYGLNAKLRGTVTLKAKSAQPLHAAGIVRIERGTYKAYGQNLTIERGAVTFNGPLDNPSLDIVAIRQGLAVEAGVQLFGPAINPRLILISDPPVSDNEKLSWLMFGKSTDVLSPQDGASVLMAASSVLIGGEEKTSLQQKIANTVGLDEIEVQSRANPYNNVANTYLTLGKRLAKKLYLSYEQGLAEVDSALKLQYILSRRWQAVVRAGTKETTFDLFYTLSFD